MKTLKECINEAIKKSNKKINPKDIYFDGYDLVMGEETIGSRLDDGGIKLNPEYIDSAKEILAILDKKYPDDFYLIEK